MFWLVDIFKFVFSLAIVALHSCFLGQYQDWLYPVVYYSAVPYFFIASGFFFARKYYIRGYSNSIYKNFCKRLFTKLLVFEPLTQVEVILILALAGTAVSTIVIETIQHIVFYPLGAMWYIQALIVAGFLLVPFIRYHKEKYIIPIAIPLYLFALCCGRYYFVIEDVSVLKEIVDGYMVYCISPKNGLFTGFLYVGLGILAARNWDVVTAKFRYVNINLMLIIAAGLFFTELYIISGYNGLEDGQYYLMQPFFVFALFLFSAKYYETPSASPKHDTKLLRNLSISIYLLHAPIQRGFILFQEISGIQSKLIGNPNSMFILTIIVALLICYPVYKNKTKHVYNWLT